MGIHTMKRILEVSKEVNLKFENVWILGNRFPEDSLRDILEEEVAKISNDFIKLLGFIPNSDEISRMNIVGENLLQLSSQIEAYQSAKEIFTKII